MIVGLLAWLLGVVLVFMLALTHPGTWPYTEGAYRQNRRSMLTSFWGGVALIAFLWPIAVVLAGVMTLMKELT